MDNVSILLSIEQSTKNLDVEVTGRCEGDYNQLALFAFSGDIIKMAKECGGILIPWTKMRGLEQFCLAFRFEKDEDKKKFFSKLLIEQR